MVCKGPAESCARATDQLQLFLGILDAPSGWRWALLDDAAWKKIQEEFRRETNLEKVTGTSFEVAAIRTVYVNLGYFSKSFSSEALRTVMHALAHITRCGTDEACAIRETQERLRALGANP